LRYKKEEIHLYKRTLPSGISVYYYRVYTPEGKRLRILTRKSKKFEAKNLTEISFISLILLPDQSNLRDDRFLVDDVKESELKKMK